MPYGVQMSRGGFGARAQSFDDGSMLPPSAIDSHEQGNPTYSPYSQGSSNGGNMFQQQQSWGYGGLPEMYSNSQVSPLQPRPAHHIPMAYHMAPQMRPMGQYGAYYPACSPGPPIQTTASNKGYVPILVQTILDCGIVDNSLSLTLVFFSDPKAATCLSFTFPIT